MKKRGTLVFVLVILALAALAIGKETDTGIPCISTEECIFYGFDQCNPSTNTCFTIEASSNQSTTEQSSNTLNSNSSSTNSNTSNTTIQTNSSTATPSATETKVTNLEQRVNSLEKDYNGLQQSQNKLTEAVNSNTQAITNLQTTVTTNAQEIANLKNLPGEVKSVATGLAAAKNDLTATKVDLSTVETLVEKERSFTKFLKYSFFILLALGVAFGIVYYLNRKASTDIDPKIQVYITKFIKQGKKYQHIKDTLVAAGWQEEQVKWAYQQTMKKNYEQYKAQQQPVSEEIDEDTPQSLTQQATAEAKQEAPKRSKQQVHAYDRNKVAMISLISIFVLIGVFFMLKGVSTGHAIFFQTEEQLQEGVKATLDKTIEKSIFYQKLDAATICAEVQDGNKSVSYSITKTSGGHTITEASLSCSQDTSYDWEFKFTDWESFDFLMNSLTCDNARKEHTHGVYVLPSKYVLPGFKFNSAEDHTVFCSILEDCLTEAEKIISGCTGDTTNTKKSSKESGESAESESSEGTTHIVKMVEKGFEPETLSIKVGDTVTWEVVREGQYGKALIIGTQDCIGIKSEMIETGQSFSHIFTEAAECSIVDGILITTKMDLKVE